MNWSTLLITKIKVCWNIQDFINLDYKTLGGYGSNNYIQYSQDPYKHIINNDVYSMPNPMPKFVNKVTTQFDYDIVAVAFNRTPPGNILPLHSDLYENYVKAYEINDINNIHRYIIFLEDAKIGHMMQIGNNVFTQWKAGDVCSWKGSTLHAAYNMGYEHRYTMQVTCSNK